MHRILFIAAHRPMRSPSQRYRFEQYFDFLENNGYSCELSYIIDEKSDRILYTPGNILGKLLITVESALRRWKDTLRSNDYDIVFVQREAFMIGSAFFERKIARTKAKLVFDFDDSIWILDTSKANEKWAWLKSEKKTGEIISVSDLVFAGNNYLANYARQFNNEVKVIPTTIDTETFRRRKPYCDNKRVCIGWSGSITTIKHFEEAVPFLKILKDKYGDRIYFKVMGDPSYLNSDLDIKGIAWSNETEVDVLESFDIGIMPLPDDQWVKGKCGLKGLSYMSLEVPTVMSAVGVNPEIIDDGKNGFLAITQEEWVNKLSLLIDSFTLRKQIGLEGRQTVEKKYSVSAQKNNYLASFNELLAKKKT